MANKPGYTKTGSVPPQLPQTAPPQEYVLSDHSSFILQAILDMKNTLGELKQAVKTLTEESQRNNTKLDKISHKIFAAEAIGALLVILGGWAIYLFSTMAPLIQSKPHP